MLCCCKYCERQNKINKVCDGHKKIICLIMQKYLEKIPCLHRVIENLLKMISFLLTIQRDDPREILRRLGCHE